jgi:hypothetical protein
MTTLGIGTCLFGTADYGEFVDRWWEGVIALNRQPDSIVIAHDSANAGLILHSVPKSYKSITTFLEMEGEYSDFMQAIQVNQKADWFSLCGIDDQYLPGAFDQLDQADAEGCDIYIDKLQLLHNGSIMEGCWAPELIPTQMTCPGAAPIKRELFLKTKGVSEGSQYDDWELYMRCVAVGAKPFHANTIRIIHDLGYNRQTRSGINRAAHIDELGKQHIANVRAELGL